LCGQKEQSKELLSGFRWGQRFIELNYEPLEEYSSAKTSQELVDLQFEFFDLEHLRSGDE
jgi:pre-rRNA-processing protein TSR3